MADRYERIRDALAMGPTPGPWGATLRDLLAERDALAAEIEALRAEVDGWKAQHSRDSAELRRLCQHRDEYKARAERLAEALALLERSLAVIRHDIDEIGGCDHSVGICCCELIHLADEIRAAMLKAREGDQ